MKKIINTTNAPSAIGPYSQGNLIGNTLYVSGQIPIDPATNKFISSTDVALQTKQCLNNAKAILHEAGFSFDDVVKVTVLLSDMNNFSLMNDVYSTFFTSNYPARIAYEVSRLPLDSLVEIDMIASK